MRKTLHAFLSLVIVIATILAPMRQANAVSAGGWAFGGLAIASETVTAIKAGASATARLASAPVVGNVAKAILVGGVGSAVILNALPALTGLTLDAVTWVLDPENNAIKYKPKNATGQMWVWSGAGQNPSADDIAKYGADTYTEACSKVAASYNRTLGSAELRSGGVYADCTWKGSSSSDQIVALITVPQQPDKWNSIPIPDVAAQIYKNAAAGDAGSINAVNTAAAAVVDSGVLDKDLDKAAGAKCGTGTHYDGSVCVADTPSTPATPADPATPFDPSSIIAAIQSLFSMLQGLLNSILTAVTSIPDLIKSVWDWAKDSFDYIKTTANTWKDAVVNEYKSVTDAVVKEYTDVRDWVYSKDDVKKADDDSKLDIPDTPSQTVDTSINFGGSCPANVEASFSLFGVVPINFTIMDWSKYCLLLSTYLKPIVIAIASYQAVRILAGQKE